MTQPPTPAEQEPGSEVTAVSIDPEGSIITVRADGSIEHTAESDTLRDRIRAQSVATQGFLKRKRRRWPILRI